MCPIPTTSDLSPETSGVAEIGTVEPGATEPGATEPGTTEPGTTEPGTTEPGTTEPETTEPETTEPETTEPETTECETNTRATREPATSAPSNVSASTVVVAQRQPSSCATIETAATTTESATPPPTPDEQWMELALIEARAATSLGEVPVGAVVVCDGVVVGRGHNRRENDRDPLAHAELLALRQAAATLGRWRLSGCTLYVTLEPCSMCAGAIVNARADRLVYGARDPKAGAAGTLYDIPRDSRLNHRAEVVAGVREAESAGLLRRFFAMRRKPAAR